MTCTNTIDEPKVSLESKLKSLLNVRRSLSEMALPTCPLVERRHEISSSEFLDKYYARNKPVIFFNLFSGSFAAKHWTLDLLKERYGTETIEVMANRDRDPLYERDYEAHRTKISLNSFIDLLASQKESNDYYLVANNHLLRSPSFQSIYNDFTWPTFLDPNMRKDRVFLWLGPAGTVTPLHHDDCNILLVQLRGRKRISLISPDFTPYVYNEFGCFSEVDMEDPDFSKFPLFREVRSFEVTLQPGEALFIPVFWWHHVRSLDISISLSFSNFAFPNQFQIAPPVPFP